MPTIRRLRAVIAVVLACWTLVQAAAGATISGQVQLAARPNDPVSNARITLFIPSLAFFTETRSDAAGAYFVEGVPAGTYQLGCAALGFDYVEASITLGAGAQQRDFDLDPESHTGQWDIIGSTAPELLDATESWSLTSNPGLLRYQTEVVQLPDGRVLVGGGDTGDPSPPVSDVLGIVKWCDLYDPTTDTWRRVADMNWHREYHAVTLLIPDGRVITTGGTHIKFQVGPTSADIEAFSPPYLFRGVRPEIASISSTEPPRGSELTLEISPETRLTSVVMIGVQTTQWVDGGIPRRIVLAPHQNGSTVTATLPTDPNVIPLGHYMVFAMVDDIPSAARIVQVVEAQGSPVGACCTAAGFCSLATQNDCVGAGEIFLGDDTSCGAQGACPVNCWSCQCLDGVSGSGEVATCVDGEFECNSLCQGHTGVQSSTCDAGPCPPTIPAVSERGLITMVLVMLTAGTRLLRHKVNKTAIPEPWRNIE